jgi:hypothetical protein
MLNRAKEQAKEAIEKARNAVDQAKHAHTKDEAPEKMASVTVYKNGKALVTVEGHSSEDATKKKQELMGAMNKTKELLKRKKKLKTKKREKEKRPISGPGDVVRKGEIALMDKEIDEIDLELTKFQMASDALEVELTGTNKDLIAQSKEEALQNWKSKWKKPFDTDFEQQCPNKPKLSPFEKALRFVFYVRSWLGFKKNMRTMSYQSDFPEQRSLRFNERTKNGEFDMVKGDMDDYYATLKKRLRVTVSEAARQRDLELEERSRRERQAARLAKLKAEQQARLEASDDEDDGDPVSGSPIAAEDETRKGGGHCVAFFTDAMSVMCASCMSKQRSPPTRVRRISVVGQRSRRPEGKHGHGNTRASKVQGKREGKRDPLKGAVKPESKTSKVAHIASKLLGACIKEANKEMHQAQGLANKLGHDAHDVHLQEAMAKKKLELKRTTRGFHLPFSKKWYKNRDRKQRKRMTRVVMVAEQVQRERVAQWRKVQMSKIAPVPVPAAAAEGQRVRVLFK